MRESGSRIAPKMRERMNNNHHHWSCIPSFEKSKFILLVVFICVEIWQSYMINTRTTNAATSVQNAESYAHYLGSDPNYSSYSNEHSKIDCSNLPNSPDNVNTAAFKDNSNLGSKDTQSIHILFSTNCAQYQDWQSEVLINAHKRLSYPGKVTRLMACDRDWTLPKNSYPDVYNVITTPVFDPQPETKDKYSPRNRPHGLAYLFEEYPDYIEDDEIVMIMDPDQILLSKFTDFNVSKGKPVAAQYGQGIGYLDWAGEFCNKECADRINTMDVKTKRQLAIGAPYILIGSDLRKLAPLWVEILEKLRLDESKGISRGGWISDMFAYSIATVQLDIIHNQKQFMISNVKAESEPWNLITPSAVIGERNIPEHPLFILHYCQSYSFGEEGFKWKKHVFKEFPFSDCKRNRKARFRLPAESSSTYKWLKKNEFSHALASKQNPNTTKEELFQWRSAWMFSNIVAYSNEAFENYAFKHC